jgi:hypothetical protein
MDYYDWLEGAVSCPSCGWKGAGRDLSLSEMFEGGAEYVCPMCSHEFGFRAFPTADEVRRDPRADPLDKMALGIREERLARHEATKLVSPVQLPALDPAPAVLVWDVVDVPGGDSEVHILHGERVLWRELSWYENYERFEEVARILKLKYGDELTDLVPTRRSWLDLLGDCLSADHHVEVVRASLGARSGSKP